VNCSNGPSRPRLVVQFHISTTIPRFSHPTTRRLMSSVSWPQKANNRQWIPLGASFSCPKTCVNSSLCDVLRPCERTSHPLWAEYNAHHHVYHIVLTRQNEAQETNNLEQVPLQGHNYYARYMRGGIASRMPVIWVSCRYVCSMSICSIYKLNNTSFEYSNFRQTSQTCSPLTMTLKFWNYDTQSTYTDLYVAN
jgi:hypothetical protein